MVNAALDGAAAVLQVAVLWPRKDGTFTGFEAAQSQLAAVPGGPSTWLQVVWPAQGSLGSLRGQTVRLRFHLLGEARLFGFQVQDQTSNE